jgi:hypothetical protein
MPVFLVIHRSQFIAEESRSAEEPRKGEGKGREKVSRAAKREEGLSGGTAALPIALPALRETGVAGSGPLSKKGAQRQSQSGQTRLLRFEGGISG